MNKTKKVALVRQLLDSSTWPDIFRPEFMDELYDLANEAFNKKTVEGYISSLLIYHQITEEMIKALIQISTFFVQVKFIELDYKDKDLNGKMFGQLISILDGCLKTDDTDKFIQKCSELNEVRIKIVHKITKKTNISEIGKVCAKSKKVFDQISAMFESIYDRWRVDLSGEKSHCEANPDDIKEILGFRI